MTRFNHIRQHTNAMLDKVVWSVSEPDQWDRIVVQVTCQGICLQSDLIHTNQAKETKQGMERLIKEMVEAKNNPKYIIRRKAA